MGLSPSCLFLTRLRIRLSGPRHVFAHSPFWQITLRRSYSTWVTLLPVSLLVGGRPHFRAPDTVEKITSRDRRDSRHTHALTLEPTHDIDCNGLIDDIRRSSMLTQRSSMDSAILLQDLFVFIFYFLYFTARHYQP